MPEPMVSTASSSMNPDFCVDIDDAEGNNLLTDATAKVQDQNSRLMEVYKKTQQNCNDRRREKGFIF